MHRLNAPASESVEQLVVTDATDDALVGRRFPLRATTAIGRIADGDGSIVLAHDPDVSARHARIERRDDGWYCVDRGSRHGTMVNGARIAAPTRLRAGDELRLGATRLVAVGDAILDPTALPFPLIASELLVRAEPTARGRARAICAAIERALKFLVACERGALFAEGLSAELPSDEWLPGAVGLAARMQRLPESAVRSAALPLIGRDHSPSRLARELGAVLARGAELQTIAEEAVVARLDEGHRTLRELLMALSPLCELSLVSRLELLDADFDRRTYSFDVRVHDGPSDVFPVTRCETRNKLLSGWCYLVGRSGASRALSLAPLFGVGVGENGRKLEVGDAATLAREPGVVELRGITSGLPLRVPFAANGRE